MTEALKRRPGRPARAVFSADEVAVLMELPVALVRARCRVSFFPGAYQVGGVWMIPEAGLRVALRCVVEPHFRLRTAAGIMGISYETLYDVTQAVTSLDEVLAPGKSVRARLVSLGATRPLMLIPECEIRRVMGGGL